MKSSFPLFAAFSILILSIAATELSGVVVTYRFSGTIHTGHDTESVLDNRWDATPYNWSLTATWDDQASPDSSSSSPDFKVWNFSGSVYTFTLLIGENSIAHPISITGDNFYLDMTANEPAGIEDTFSFFAENYTFVDPGTSDTYVASQISITLMSGVLNDLWDTPDLELFSSNPDHYDNKHFNLTAKQYNTDHSFGMTGNVTGITPVPEPEHYGLSLSLLLLMGLRCRETKPLGPTK